MNMNVTDDVRKEDDKKLPVLKSLRHPLFNGNLVHVIFLLGGPGSGKGTQSEKLVKDWGFVHLSAGELLRAEMKKEGSEYGALIQKYIQEGEIVPMEITVGLLQNAMLENARKDRRKFLIDGFPRKMDQAIAFEANVLPFVDVLMKVVESKIVLYLEGPEDVLVKRLMARGRSDDNEETIKKRLQVNQRDAEPVVNYFEKQKKLYRIPCALPPEGTVFPYPTNRRRIRQYLDQDPRHD
jgi:UMP-CMP kinase